MHYFRTNIRSLLRLLTAGIVIAACAYTINTQAQSIRWHSFEHALTVADSTGKPVLVDVWAPWCGWCMKMKQEVYPNLPTRLAERFVWTRLNRDDNTTKFMYRGDRSTPLRLAQQFEVESVPALVLLSSDGTNVLRLSGYREADSLAAILGNVVDQQ